MKELKQQFDEVCKAYLEAFIKRHNLSTADWIGQGVGEVVCVNDEFFLNFDDIRYDIDNADKLHINEIWNWTAYCQRLDFLECPKRINFQSWCKGAPKPYTDKMLDEIEGLHQAAVEAKKRLDEARKADRY
mgnify:FL=1